MRRAIETALVTGGGSGIGAALAIELARRGCDVVVSGRRERELEQSAERSERISACVGDVTDASDRARLVAELAARRGPRAVVHLAGFFQAGALDTLSVEEWRRSFDVNVEARWLLSRECAHLVDRGRVLFIGSDAGANPRAGAAAYSVAQAGSETVRRALQAEWAGSGRAVGAFKPGLVDTDMVRGFMQLSSELFPARAAYDAYVERGEVASARTVAQFASWLLLDVEVERFAETEWDIRDTEHHVEWAVAPLYPTASAQERTSADARRAPTD